VTSAASSLHSGFLCPHTSSSNLMAAKTIRLGRLMRLVARWPAVAFVHAVDVEARPHPFPGAYLYAVIPSTVSLFISQTQQVASIPTRPTDDTKTAAEAAGARRSL